MRTIVAANCLVLLASSAFSAVASAAAPASKKPTPAPAATAPAATPTSSPAEALAGWSDLRWGMTTGEVAMLHPEGRWRLLRLLFPTTILNEGFDVEAVFEGGRLTRIEMEWAIGDRSSDDARQQALKRFSDALAEKYGPPSSRNAEAAVWVLPKTKIEAAINRDLPRLVRLMLVYSDAAGGNAKGNL